MHHAVWPQNRIVGLQGYGSEHVVFRVTTPDGKDAVYKTYVTHLGFHIREIPLFLSGAPMYDINRLNRKLDKLTGEPRIDQMANDYNRIFSGILQAIHRLGFKGVVRGYADLQNIEALMFIVCSSPFMARLQDFSEMGNSEDDPDEIIFVNGPSFEFSESRSGLRRFSLETIEAINSIRPATVASRPGKLSYNPLFVWSAAMTDSFSLTTRFRWHASI